MIIRKLRLEKGLSQEQLAEMAGISTRTLQRIERGANASPETLKCLGAVLEVDFKDLRKEQQMTQTIPDHAAQPMTQSPLANAETKQQAQPTVHLGAEERDAMEYVRDIKGFYSHAIKFAIIMTGLLIINLVTNPGNLWVVWPALGWGIGVLVHGMSVYEIFDFFGPNWEKKQIEKRMRR